VSADLARMLDHKLERTDAPARSRAARARIVLSLGPATALAGVVWAVAQPWRVTVLHPAGQGFWWLFSEPPLYVVLVGVLFRFLLAPGIVADLMSSVTGAGSSRSPIGAKTPKDRNPSPWRIPRES
jgi:hypothetical protein